MSFPISDDAANRFTFSLKPFSWTLSSNAETLLKRLDWRREVQFYDAVSVTLLVDAVELSPQPRRYGFGCQRSGVNLQLESQLSSSVR